MCEVAHWRSPSPPSVAFGDKECEPNAARGEATMTIGEMIMFTAVMLFAMVIIFVPLLVLGLP